ncbi:hypothetical protein AT15_01185 [Kosmotoga arenicorallina S304]|uniref:HTH arsR-type domain-containing protein n=1 Tax=Kosmotoga arenicorallina S304 TaxID=1453497 RepID=A0A176K0K7_9BACT|nr:hypothetical protein AT15_01185 [Kosmotoga arenicorallina S304]
MNNWLVDIFKALGCEWRIEILKTIAAGKANCLCQLEPLFPLDKTTLSRHIKALVRAGLLLQRKKGVLVELEISSPEVLELISLATKIAKKQKGL